ncbi:MAG: tyrosine-type recombinase/integrase [Opitutaceae bacterium]
MKSNTHNPSKPSKLVSTVVSDVVSRMASLRKFKASRFWFAVYRDATGKQCNRSTKISVAGDGENVRARGTDAAAKRRLAHQIAKTYEDTERGHPTEQHVQKVLLDIFEKVNKKRIEPKITETFFRNWLDGVRTARPKGGTAERYGNVIERFLDSLGTRRKVQLADILPGDVQSFVAAAASDGKAAATVKFEHKIIKSVFADALNNGHVLSNPAAAVKTPPAAGESRKPFEWHQVRAILQAAEGDWKTAVMLGVYTGARLGDCVSMEWRQVDFQTGEKGVLRFRPSKTKAKGGEIVIPLHKDLAAHLKSLPMPDGENAGKQPLCPELAKVKISGRSGLSRKFKELLGAAGVENEQTRQGEGKGRSLSAYSFHSLRHTFNTVLMNKGVPQELRMKLSGHASEAMNSRYSHAEIETLRAAVGKLPGVAK